MLTGPSDSFPSRESQAGAYRSSLSTVMTGILTTACPVSMRTGSDGQASERIPTFGAGPAHRWFDTVSTQSATGRVLPLPP
jgi:hypothetical protein